jgi:hypothetical protein
MGNPERLPDPAKVRRLMSQMSDKVADIVARMVALAIEYGVHGRIQAYGLFLFQLTRINERWSVYITASSGHPRELPGARIDEKLLFLEHAEEFEADYSRRILDVYEKLKKTVEGGVPRKVPTKCANCNVALKTGTSTPTLDCPKCGKKYSADAEDWEE